MTWPTRRALHEIPTWRTDAPDGIRAPLPSGVLIVSLS